MSRNIKRRISDPGSEVPIVSSNYEEFARRLDNKLRDLGWSQSDLARKVWNNETRTDNRGYEAVVGRDRISAYCRGKAMPEPATLRRIAEILNMDPVDLAPDIAAATIEKENPALQITMVAGRSDKCLLRVNRLMPLSIAVEIAKLIDKAEEMND